MEKARNSMAPKNGLSARLSRDQWLARALDVLAMEGHAKLRLETICSELGVTRGSFYWHFKDRDDFVRSVVLYWSGQFTDPVIDHIRQLGDDAQERLRSLMHFVSEGGYARYDVCVRAWAAQDPGLVAKIVEDVDRRRLTFVRSLFTGMGFEGRESEFRARACIAYLMFEASVLVKSADQDRSKMLNRFFDVIVQP